MERCLPEHCPTQEGLYLVNRRYGLWTRGRPPRTRLGLAHCHPAPRLHVPASQYGTTAATFHTTPEALQLSWRPFPGHTIDETAGAVVAEIKATPRGFSRGGRGKKAARLPRLSSSGWQKLACQQLSLVYVVTS